MNADPYSLFGDKRLLDASQGIENTRNGLWARVLSLISACAAISPLLPWPHSLSSLLCSVLMEHNHWEPT